MMGEPDEDRLIADSAAAFLERAGGLDRVRRLRDGGGALDRATWRGMADLGWIGVLVPQDAGGLGMTLREVAILLEAAGRWLPVEPLAGAIAAAAAIAQVRADSPALAALLAGDAVVVPVEGAAVTEADGGLSGSTDVAADVAAADAFLLVAGQGGDARLRLVPKAVAGLRVEAVRTVDGGSAGRLHLDGVRTADATALAEGEAAVAAARTVMGIVRFAHAACLVGLADEALRRSVAYLNERRQFGVPIGSFQALQHRAATLYVRLSAARALLHEAAQAADPSAAGAAAKLVASETALLVTKESIQFHGAIGFTDEHPIGLYLRRAMAVAGAGGTTDACLDAFAGA
ncbi:acyl-CoA dehydrogenase family protein [Azospirillum sp.]|uniref:acyl-CoA dehydrogenase family protein n=1 Tax=Azospirillum sp. TaxID=34012 RepID=UPI002D48E4B4|nr:acyl-CoA dehydrogenase family protein [Azospirillum sp.]HYD69005.1 acyl-CoA dehydrogenase family protein [Azospirillum sp.]